jgi:hypothetical protein
VLISPTAFARTFPHRRPPSTAGGLLELYREKFGDHIPLRNQASAIEIETRNFYEGATARAQDVHIRQLLDDLAQEERQPEISHARP